jgi:hypothetical protein
MTTDGQKNSIWYDLGREWGIFLTILLKPMVVGLLIVTIVMIAVQILLVDVELDPFVDAIFTILISIFSGGIGAIISDKLTAIREEGILVTRGKSAIRGLELLLEHLSALEKRIAYFAQAVHEEAPENKLVIENSYGEFLGHCNSLQEEAVNAIEEWQDIIPEAANSKTRIGLISRLKAEKQAEHERLIREVSELQAQLDDEKERSEEEKEKLLKKLREKESQLSRATIDLHDTELVSDYSLDGSLAKLERRGGIFVDSTEKR